MCSCLLLRLQRSQSHDVFSTVNNEPLRCLGHISFCRHHPWEFMFWNCYSYTILPWIKGLFITVALANIAMTVNATQNQIRNIIHLSSVLMINQKASSLFLITDSGPICTEQNGALFMNQNKHGTSCLHPWTLRAHNNLVLFKQISVIILQHFMTAYQNSLECDNMAGWNYHDSIE